METLENGSTEPNITTQIDIVGQPENQVKNRKPGTWLPGQSGNPKGRPPKGHSIVDILTDMMNEKPEIKRALGSKLFQLALDGDLNAIKVVMQYLDGMPVQRTELTGADGEPLAVQLLQEQIRKIMDDTDETAKDQ